MDGNTTAKTDEVNEETLMVYMAKYVFVLITLSIIYLLCSTLRFEIKKRKPQSKNENMKLGNLLSALYFALLGNTVVLLTMHSSLYFRFIVNVQTCNWVAKLIDAITIFDVCLVYAILFTRQKTLHSQGTFQGLTNSCGSVVANVSFTIFLCSQMGFYVILFFHSSGQSVGGYCIKLKIEEKYRKVMLLTYYTILVCVQFTFTGLFAAPLVRYRNNCNEQIRRKSSTRKFIACVKRTLLISSICFISDTLAFFGTASGVQLQANTIPELIVIFTIVLNVIGLLFIFVDWKQRIFPWVKTRE